MRARLAELPLIIVLLGISGLLALVPAVHALVLDQHEVARDFLYSALVILMLTVLLGIATAAYSPRNAARSHLAGLVLAYAILPFALALPMIEALPDTSLANAWFEMVSSLTTTGASVYLPDRLPASVHLWRAMVGWFGGYLMILAAYAILAPLNLGGTEVASGRVPGRGAPGAGLIQQTANPADRLLRFALRLFPVYAALTALLWFGLILSGGDGLTSLIHAMGTLSTSGISGHTAFDQAGTGAGGEMLVLVCLVFAVTRCALPGIGRKRAQPLLRDPELRLAGLILTVVVLGLAARHWILPYAADERPESLAEGLSAVWGLLFTAASFLTTTGYVSAEWQAAQDTGIAAPGLLLLALAIIGGGTATTAGGYKLLRVYALLRHGERELERIVHPNSLGRGGAEARRLRREGAQLAWVFFMLFATSIAVVMAMLTLLGLEFDQAMGLALAALTTTGPLAELGPAQPIDYADLTVPVKAVLGAAMVVGRLEMLALLALILPGRGQR